MKNLLIMKPERLTRNTIYESPWVNLYLDKVRFYYNSRASHFEAFEHWLELLSEREKITKDEFNSTKETAFKLQIKLNNFITVTAKKGRNKNDKV